MEETLFKIVEDETGNTVGRYSTRAQAEAALRSLAESYPRLREHFVLVSMDKDGHPLKGQVFEDLFAVG
jgi:hypothetical protein